MRLSEAARGLQATVVRDAEFSDLGFLFDDLPDKLIFVEAPEFVSAARKARGVACVLCTPELASCFPDVEGMATTAEPKLAFFHLQRFLVEQTDFYGAPVPTEIDSSARIHPRAWIAPLNVRIGCNTVIEANVSVGEHSSIGAGVHRRAGAGPWLGRFPILASLRRNTANGSWRRCVRAGQRGDIRERRHRQSRLPPDDFGGQTFANRQRRLCVPQRSGGAMLFRRPQRHHQRKYHCRR